MSDTTRIAATAALLGDPARANMLAALMDGRALTAKELAFAAHVSPPDHQRPSGQADRGRAADPAEAGPASLLPAGLAAGRPDAGGHHGVWPARPRPHLPERRTTWRGGEALRTARSCYDHLAGRLGVGLADSLCERGHGGADRRRRRGHRHRPPLPARLRRGTRAGAARVLPPLPGLERAPAAHRRPAGRGAGVPVLRAGLDRSASATRARWRSPKLGRAGFAEEFGVRL